MAPHPERPGPPSAALDALRRAVESRTQGTVCFVAPSGPRRTDTLHALGAELLTSHRAVHLPRGSFQPGGLWIRVAQALAFTPGYDARRRVLHHVADLVRKEQSLLLLVEDADALPAESLYALLTTARAEPGFLMVLACAGERSLAGPLPDDVAVVRASEAERTAPAAPAPEPVASPAAAAPRPAREPIPLESEATERVEPPDESGAGTIARLASRRVRRERRRRAAWGVLGLALGAMVAGDAFWERFAARERAPSVAAASPPRGAPADARAPVAPPGPAEPQEPPARPAGAAGPASTARPAPAAGPASAWSPGPSVSPAPPAAEAASPPPAEARAPAAPPAAAPEPARTPPPPAAAPEPEPSPARVAAPAPAAPAETPSEVAAKPPAAEPRAPARPRAERAPEPAPRREAPLALGALRVDSDSPVMVEIDGRAYGPAPVAGVRLTQGEHRVLAHYADGAVAMKTVFVGDADVSVFFR